MPNTDGTTNEDWPALPYEEWKDTYATLHMWMQVVGKVALARATPVNHSWAIAFHLTARGLSTGLLVHDRRTYTIAFDFIDHQLVIETSDGIRRSLPLSPLPVAAFYREVMAALEYMGLPVRIWPVPVEVPSPIPFLDNIADGRYEPESVRRCWRVLMQVHHVFTAARSNFAGKCSPVHFFWGSFDLAVTRFSGRPAPPREGPAFMRDAYSHEVISHGFWPGNAQFPEPVFYAYAVPEPEGLSAARIEPDGAFYHPELKEFVLPYEAARSSTSPEVAITAFVRSTFEQAAGLAKWSGTR